MQTTSPYGDISVRTVPDNPKFNSKETKSRRKAHAAEPSVAGPGSLADAGDENVACRNVSEDEPSDEDGHDSSEDGDVDGFLTDEDDAEYELPPQVVNRELVWKGSLVLAVFVSVDHSSLHAAAAQWNSGLLNYVTPRTFGSAYPLLTRDRIALINPGRLRDGWRPPRVLYEAKRQWRKRGWQLANSVSELIPVPRCDGVSNLACVATMRYFEDKWCAFGSMAVGVPPQDWAARKDLTLEETVVWWRGGPVCNMWCRNQLGGRNHTPVLRTALWALLPQN
ncbi:hypothetical protein C8Q76DRAFT_802387 [Earliella scabrosa]|nr:hypothetical protein C8Q76DRAFT_802387 [Earliella scabrosa]